MELIKQKIKNIFFRRLESCKQYSFQRFPNSIFFIDDVGNYWFELDLKNYHFYCRYDKFWSIFEKYFNLNYDKIQLNMKDIVEDAFKQKKLTPINVSLSTSLEVEDAFKQKKLTPYGVVQSFVQPVEDAFKQKKLTPINVSLSTSLEVEDAFKQKKLTPYGVVQSFVQPVEDAFKQKELTLGNNIHCCYHIVEDAFKQKKLTPLK